MPVLTRRGATKEFQRARPSFTRRAEDLNRVFARFIDSPVGPLLAGATDDGIVLLEFTEGRREQRGVDALRRRLGVAVASGEHPWLERLEEELADYFAGRLTSFTVPLVMRGTKFQEASWRELLRIPYGSTISYAEQSRRIGRPTAVRAVANANGRNRIAIVIPCHRVIGKDGTLTGFGGGLWRKRLLLDLEQRGRS